MHKKRSKPTEKAGEAWQHQAACRDMNPNIFFPNGQEEHPLAAQTCAICPVQAQCKQLAQQIRQDYGLVVGIFAGVRYYIKGKTKKL